MKILAITGSPRRNSNTERLVRTAMDADQREGTEIAVTDITRQHISPCDGCGFCIESGPAAAGMR